MAHQPPVVALAGVLVVVAVVHWQYQPPDPLPTSSAPEVFSAERAMEVLRDVLDDQRPHPAGSEANDRVRERLIAQLDRLELHVETQHVTVADQPLVNVLARLGPDDGTVRPLVLATHYDSVPQGPGAADAGACVAALVETARAMRHQAPYARPVYFLFSDGEEMGLLGARGFVREHPLAARRPLVLNFDARGTEGPSLMFETHEGNLELVRHLAAHLPAPAITSSGFVTVYRILPNDTDFSVFRHDGWSGLNFAFIDGAHRYHTAADRIENLDVRSVQHHGNSALALGRSLAATTDELDGATQDAVFFDLLGAAVVWFPASWALPLAVAALVVVLAAIARDWAAVGGSAGFGRGAGLLAATLLAAMAVTAAAAVGVRSLVLNTGLYVAMFTPYDRLISLGFWLVALAVLALLGWAILRRATAESAVAAVWAGWAAAAVVVALGLPGLSYLLSLPSLVAGLAALVLGCRGWAAAVATVAASVMIVPPLYLLPIVLGPFWAAGLQCALYAMALTPLYPFIGRTARDAAAASPARVNRLRADRRESSSASRPAR